MAVKFIITIKIVVCSEKKMRAILKKEDQIWQKRVRIRKDSFSCEIKVS